MRIISFRVVNYGPGCVFLEETDEGLEGKVLRELDNGSLLVFVEGYELPFYVEPEYTLASSRAHGKAEHPKRTQPAGA